MSKGSRTVWRVWVLLLLLAAACGPAWALEPGEVLVVANRKAPASVELATLYVQLRGVPAENVALLDASREYSINHEEYDAQIRLPLARLLKERRLEGKIRSVVMMKGLPVRIVAGPVRRDREEAYRAGAAEAQRRMAMVLLLADRVGGAAPAKVPQALLPAEGQFGGPAPSLPASLPGGEALKDRLADAVVKAQLAAGKIADAEIRRTACRQAMALTLEAYGVSGLIRYVTADKPAGAPPAEALVGQLAELERRIGSLRGGHETADEVKVKLALMRAAHGATHVWGYADPLSHAAGPRAAADPTQTVNAAVDSELSLLWWGRYRLEGWLPNPDHWENRAMPAGRPPVLMVSRLDGPGYADAQRMLRDSVAVEKTGLRGRFYIDAGGPARLAQAAVRFDGRLKALADFTERHSRMQVILDEKPTVFGPGTCPDAALYTGWYSLRKYVPAFAWNRGAIGYHIASFEATDLHNPDSSEWCPSMIRAGVAATIGPVQEPYLLAFPLPDELFPLILTGKFTLAECYWRTVPVVSWQMMLLGDPLYNPFAANPQIPLSSLPANLAPPALPRAASAPGP